MKSTFGSIILTLALIVVGYSASVLAGENGAFDENKICKAGIAKIMGRNPAIIKIDREEGGSIFLSYVRQDDQTKWKFKCKIENSRIIWGADNGRWRTHSADSKVTFKVSNNSITVTDLFSDGSSSKETFVLEQFNN